MKREEIIKNFKNVWGDSYDYSLVNDINNRKKDKIAIICPIHGVFYKTYEKHFNSKQGCQECSGKKRYSTEDFLKKIKNLPNTNNITFENVKYVNNKTKIELCCHEKDENGNEHGYFKISPQHFIGGEGCPKCRYVKSANKKRRNIQDVINECINIHGDKYDYSLITEYKNDRIKYPIICKEHGVFYQTFNNHIKGKQGCPKCGRISCDNLRKMTFEQFKEKANRVHDNYYSYNEKYDSSKVKIGIKCPKHGIFYMTPANHLQGEGCPKCNNSSSKAEKEIYEYISSIIGSENVIERDRKTLPEGKEIDIYIPSLKIAIEYDGLYWHNEDHKAKLYHLDKTEECEKLGIHLFHIFEDEWNYKQDIIKSMLENLLNNTKNSIFARKCEIKEVSSLDAKQFLNENHLQGWCPSKIRVGLYYDNELVSLMSFGKSRHFIGNGKYEYELLRFANKKYTRIVGGASKLLSFFIKKYNPLNIVSYADRRWSNGNLYKSIGFTQYNISKPNYYYIIGNKRIYRFNLRKQVLIKKYNCPENMTEKEFCKNQGWKRIYDCGCLCYVWKKEK